MKIIVMSSYPVVLQEEFRWSPSQIFVERGRFIAALMRSSVYVGRLLSRDSSKRGPVATDRALLAVPIEGSPILFTSTEPSIPVNSYRIVTLYND